MAEYGDVESNYTLGMIYKNNEIEEINYQLSFDYLMFAAENGHALAQCELALCFYKGIGIDKNSISARLWLDESLKQNCAYAYCILGQSYYMGWGGDLNYDEAAKSLDKAQELGFADVETYRSEMESIRDERQYANVSYGAGLFFEDDSYPLKEPERAANIFESASKHGSPIAKLNLAKLKLGGTEKEFNELIASSDEESKSSRRINEAFSLLRSAASNNLPEACYLLCKLLDMGVFTTKEMTLERYGYYLSIAAKSGLVDAQKLYVIWTLDKRSADLSEGTAFFYADSISEQDPECMCLYGRCYLDGIGVSKDLKKAVSILEKASEMGYPPDKYLNEVKSELEFVSQASYNYGRGMIFCEGSAPLLEPDKYYQIFLSYANKNDPAAQLNLARCYYNGTGIEKNQNEALEWLLKSINNHYSEAYFAAFILISLGTTLPWIPSNNASYYLQKAAEYGSAEAMYIWADLNDTPPFSLNRQKVFEYYYKAAMLDYAPAFYSLGYCYELGRGVQPNVRLAYHWYKKASEYSNAPKIKNALERVRGDLVKAGVSLDEC